MTAWYRAGTVSVTNGSTAVVGATTAWTYQVQAGDHISFDGGGKWYEVASVTDNTHIVLASAFAESTASGLSYAIARVSPQWSLTSKLSLRIGELLDGRTDILKGDGPPSSDVGRVGSFYVDKTNYKFHERTDSGWDAGISFFGGPQGAGYGGSSTSSIAIGTATGTRTAHIGTGYAYEVGTRVRFFYNAANFVEGPVTAYSGGDLTIAPDRVKGSGTYTSWTVSVAGNWPDTPMVNGDDGGVEALSDTPNPDEFTVRSRMQTDARTGTSETISDSSRGKLVRLTNAGAIAASLTPNTAWWYARIEAAGSGAVTITPSHGTINGAATLVLASTQSATVIFDGTNWSALVSNAVTKAYVDGQIASLDSAVAAAMSTQDDAIAAKLTSPMTTEGDLIIQGASGPTRLPIGSNNYYLRVNTGVGGKMQWVSVAPGAFDIAALTPDTSPGGKYIGGTTGSGNVKFPVDKIGGGVAVEFWPATALAAKITSGAASASIDAGTSDNVIKGMTFNANASSYAQGFFKPPPSWDGTTLKFRPVYTVNPAATGQFTSTTSVAVGTGSKSFILNATNQGFTVGEYAFIYGVSTSNWMYGIITGYNGTTKQLDINVTDSGGSGTLASWKISGSVVWEMKAAWYGNNVDMNGAFGTGVKVNGHIPAPSFVAMGAQSSEITPSGTSPSHLGLLFLQIGRLGTDAVDNSAVAVTLVGFELEYKRSKNTEA